MSNYIVVYFFILGIILEYWNFLFGFAYKVFSKGVDIMSCMMLFTLMLSLQLISLFFYAKKIVDEKKKQHPYLRIIPNVAIENVCFDREK